VLCLNEDDIEHLKDPDFYEYVNPALPGEYELDEKMLGHAEGAARWVQERREAIESTREQQAELKEEVYISEYGDYLVSVFPVVHSVFKDIALS
jgi:hypothetical protein